LKTFSIRSAPARLRRAIPNTAPTGLTFSPAASEASALSIGSLASGAAYGVWIKRTVNPTTQRYPNNSFSIMFKADTV